MNIINVLTSWHFPSKAMKCTIMISAPGKRALNHLILGAVWPKPGWTQVKE